MEKRNNILTILSVCFLLLLACGLPALLSVYYNPNPEPVYTDLEIVQMYSFSALRRGDCYFITILPSPVDYTAGKESDCLSTTVTIHKSIEEAADLIRKYLEEN